LFDSVVRQRGSTASFDSVVRHGRGDVGDTTVVGLPSRLVTSQSAAGAAAPGGGDRASAFVGSIPDAYDEYMVPMLFAPYAADLAGRLADLTSGSLLEIAAGTGAVTRRLAASLPPAVEIIATDLNQPMLDRARTVGTARPVRWQQADVGRIPFEDGSFDAVVCQFGVMFFPDRPAAFAELHRVLRPGGMLLFSVWTGVDDNALAGVIAGVVAASFPDDPPRFVERVPHGYHDHAQIEADVRGGGFDAPTIDVVDARSRAATSRDVALAFCRGTPTRNEIEARDPARLEEIVDLADAAVAAAFGETDVDAPMRALVVTVTR
jgi:SAM-dependent methyltransferase